jgi:hypothetical protein
MISEAFLLLLRTLGSLTFYTSKVLWGPRDAPRLEIPRIQERKKALANTSFLF